MQISNLCIRKFQQGAQGFAFPFLSISEIISCLHTHTHTDTFEHCDCCLSPAVPYSLQMAPGSGRPPSGTWWTMWSMTLCAKFSPTINRHRQRRRTASAWTRPRKCVCLFMTCFWFYFCIKLQTKPLFHLVTTRAGHTNLFAKLLQVTLWGWCGFYFIFLLVGCFLFFVFLWKFYIQYSRFEM